MPELPEVETVRLGLAPVLVGNRFACVEQRRGDLRFPLPLHFAERLAGRKIEALDRRAKYLLARLDDGEVLVMHLGMTGRFSIDTSAQGARSAVAPTNSSAQAARSAIAPTKNGASYEPGSFAHAERLIPKHEHIVFHLADGATVRYSDARRFGLMDLIPSATLQEHALFKGLGLEPMGAGFTPAWLGLRLKGKATSIKAALLDQKLIAGLGNIYVCEALYRAGISPIRLAGTLATKTGKPTKQTQALVKAIKAVLAQAIKAGGSSLRDYVGADGRLGRFQHAFRVYGREGKPCRTKGCRGTVARIVQNGRSTFYCPNCQR
jgi:formamidopyrimidine-DNA glycosylase